MMNVYRCWWIEVVVLLCVLICPIQGTKYVKELVLYETTTGTNLGRFYDGRVLDLAQFGTPTSISSKNISVVADVDTTMKTGTVTFMFDMKRIRTISVPPKAINGSIVSQVLLYPPLNEIGVHLLTYHSSNPTTNESLQQIESVSISVIDSVNVRPFAPFTLINTNTNSEINLPNIISLSEAGTALSILANVQNKTNVAKVLFWFDNQFVRTESSAVWALNGNVGNKVFSYLPLTSPGIHSIRARAIGFTNEYLGELTHTFKVTEGSPSQLVPSVSPVFIASPVMLQPIPSPNSRTGAVKIIGELRKWHKVILEFSGPFVNETGTAVNPFMDYRLDVTFIHLSTNKTYIVPGYFAADGNAAETSATAGNRWHCNFAPDDPGVWTYSVVFVTGTNVSVTGGGVPTSFHGVTGNFNIALSDKSGRDHRGKGRLQYVGEHHLKFADGEWFLKAGVDSPENFLAYDDFDNTPDSGGRRKSWGPHKVDFRLGDPTWQGGKGTGIIGAINYLSGVGMNVFSFLTLNINGDDKNVFPYVSESPRDRLTMDVSKLAQWEILFEHADRMGMFLHFKVTEAESDLLLDRGSLGNERKLYYRELIARFGHHLAMCWNLSEELSNAPEKVKEFADYFHSLDPYGNMVVVNAAADSLLYSELTGHESIEGATLQASLEKVYTNTLRWVTESATSGQKWVVWNSQQNPTRSGLLPDSVDPDHDSIRQLALWGNIMAGGAGIEYYFGHGYENSDMTCEDFRSRAIMWKQSRHALEFFYNNRIEFWKMYRDAHRLPEGSTDWVLISQDGDYVVIYRRSGSGLGVYLNGLFGRFIINWYNPREGGALQDGTVTTVPGGSSEVVDIGLPPDSNDKDWIVLLKRVSS